MEALDKTYHTIGEASKVLGTPQHVLRFWETKFSQIRPMKRAGGRRFYSVDDIRVIRVIKALLYDQGYSVKGAQKKLKTLKKQDIMSLEISQFVKIEGLEQGKPNDSHNKDMKRVLLSMHSDLLKIQQKIAG